MNRAQRLEQYLETERLEWADLIEGHRKERDEKERRIDQALHQERREGSNWLENREMRISEMVLEAERLLIAARFDLRKRLAQECPEMLSVPELAKLEDSILRSVQSARAARRDDYKNRARAAGVRMLRPEQQDAGKYGELEASVRREIRKLQLDCSLGRGAKPAKPWVTLAKKVWHDPVWSNVIGGIIFAALGVIVTGVHFDWWWVKSSAQIQIPPRVDMQTPISVRYTNVPLNSRLWLAIKGTNRFWTYGTCNRPGSLIERTSSLQATRDQETATWAPREKINIGSQGDAGEQFTVFVVLVDESTDRTLADEFKAQSESCGNSRWDGRESLPGSVLAMADVTRR